ncbi:uncharacterized protein LOC105208006 [Solenopsis invicta]|uniref:uncharacterized protein LOC105208006 n=1 Tax=Solenopsis invicta TaxID=13686 RepID=UPI00193CD4EB|nr:uncharacterized protein LOC105208006 [Solenopsis invicta]
MDNIQNKTAIVTGAGSGIGYHITKELLSNGAKKVAILDLPIVRSYEATVSLQEKFGKDRVIFFPIDLTNLEVFNETFKHVVKALNGLDILVNNAGISHDRCVEQMYAINVVALIRGSMLGINYMGKHKGGKGGTIVNIASITGIISYPLSSVYGSTKAAVIGFSLNLEKFYDKTGVRILTICPAVTITPMLTTRNKYKSLDIVDDDIVKNLVDNEYLVPQSAAHVGQSVVVTIQKGENGLIWVIKENKPPYPVKLPLYITDHQTMDNVQNKTAIVTGAGSGIGYHITEELLSQGAKTVAILDLPIVRSYEATVSLQEKFGKDRVILFPIDLTNLELFNETFKNVVKALNGLDILVNNAGICHDCCVEQMYAINVVALIRGSMLGINYMGKHKGGKGGTIVNIASAGGIISYPIRPVCGSSKAAVVGFSLNLEKFYDKTGVRILTICPAVTITPMITTKNEYKSLDIVDDDIVKNWMDNEYLVPQSAAHVGQSVVVTIQKGENGSIWVIKENKPPYSVKLPLYITD